ncbi:hypothetical protein BDY17DRAFT_195270 [Neohortaea acidophila]|uniref:Uncharacterized protein n=1 Tax=Neohortaea acidophila TaxID=245834 RepID=A0A6A6PLQ5_9PEZI|nr:uncharacterized protein BDY17DRAFT_195270 [Neohortaea acidophila]KAF2480594.1 hypothetical protein BDY17DRAFT_195270 [Neohortaea acidophila]
MVCLQYGSDARWSGRVVARGGRICVCNVSTIAFSRYTACSIRPGTTSHRMNGHALCRQAEKDLWFQFDTRRLTDSVEAQPFANMTTVTLSEKGPCLRFRSIVTPIVLNNYQVRRPNWKTSQCLGFCRTPVSSLPSTTMVMTPSPRLFVEQPLSVLLAQIRHGHALLNRMRGIMMNAQQRPHHRRPTFLVHLGVDIDQFVSIIGVLARNHLVGMDVLVEVARKGHVGVLNVRLEVGGVVLQGPVVPGLRGDAVADGGAEFFAVDFRASLLFVRRGRGGGGEVGIEELEGAYVLRRILRGVVLLFGHPVHARGASAS